MVEPYVDKGQGYGYELDLLGLELALLTNKLASP